MAWREKQKERERLAREREEEERKKREERVKLFLQNTPSPGGVVASATPAPPSSSSSPSSLTSSTSESSPSVTNKGSGGGWWAKGSVGQSTQRQTVASPRLQEVPVASSPPPSLGHVSVASSSSFATSPAPQEHVADGEVAATERSGGGSSNSNNASEVADLQARLAAKDEEIRMLKEAFKERMREKEDEFKKRWAAENEAEVLAHKLSAAEGSMRDREQEAKRLKEQVSKLESQVKSLKEENAKLKKKHTNKNASSSKVVYTPRDGGDLKGKKMIAIFNFEGNKADGELCFVEGDVIEVMEKVNDGWWDGQLTNGERGIFPFNYVQPLVIFTSDEDAGHARNRDDEEEPPQPKTLEKVAYAKKKIEEKYKALTQALLGSGSTELTDELQGSGDSHSTVEENHAPDHEDVHDEEPQEDVPAPEIEEVEAAAETEEVGEESTHTKEDTLSEEQAGPASSQEPDADAAIVDSSLSRSSDQKDEEEAQTAFEGVALFDFEAEQEGELALKQGDRVLVIDTKSSSEWWFGRLPDGTEGHFPSSYIQTDSPSS